MNTTTFRLRRPLITSNGSTSDIDPLISQHLAELDSLLGKHVFDSTRIRHTDGDEKTRDLLNGETRGKMAKGKPAEIAETDVVVAVRVNLIEELKKPIYPKKTTPDKWDNRGLLNTLYNNPDNENLLSISDAIDKTNQLANLKYEYQDYITQNWNSLSNEYRAILNYGNISDYFLAYAFFVKSIEETNALNNFIKTGKFGLSAITKFATVSAARFEIQRQSLNIEPVVINGITYTYNDDEHPLIKKIAASNLSLSEFSFSKELNGLIDDYVFNNDYMELIASANIGTIPSDYIPILIKYIKSSPVKITKSNINYFLPLFISEISGSPVVEGIDTPVDEIESDKDFDVVFFESDKSTDQANASNVKCAAQLFYSMVVGEEMDVFNLMNYFTHKYLIKQRFDITDKRLRKYIQDYVFSNEFPEFKIDPLTKEAIPTGRVFERTRPAERQMFFRQVFNTFSQGQVTEDLIVNTDFNKLWKVLILESYNYIERAQESPNPDSYVSRQNVMQAVEELQYNLSANCTGMATVFSPIIYKELVFIIDVIFSNKKILQQVVPSSGSWHRVVETLWTDMKQTRINSQFTYNKAKLSQSIISKIANYNPASFEQDKEFSAFMSDVTALISTQSMIQQNLRKGILEDEPETKESGGNGYNSYNGYKDSEAIKKATPELVDAEKDEWDF
jgi:hypothetical protein